MNNKVLEQRLMAKIKEIRQTHAVNNNSIFSAQKQIDSLYDILELVIMDDKVQMTAQRQQPQGGGAYYPQAAQPQSAWPQDRPPTVEEAESMDVPQTNETQIFMTHRGTKVVPPAFTGVRPFILPPGTEIPKFPSLREYQEAQRAQYQPVVNHPPGYQLGYPAMAQQGYPQQGIGSPSQITVPGVHPSGAPPGISGPSFPAVPGNVAQSVPNAPMGPLTTAQSVPMAGPAPGSLLPGGIPGDLAHMIGRGTITDAALNVDDGGARNITSGYAGGGAPVGSPVNIPVNAYPGGQVVTE